MPGAAQSTVRAAQRRSSAFTLAQIGFRSTAIQPALSMHSRQCAGRPGAASQARSETNLRGLGAVLAGGGTDSARRLRAMARRLRQLANELDGMFGGYRSTELAALQRLRETGPGF